MLLVGLWNKPEPHKPRMAVEPPEPSGSSHAEAKSLKVSTAPDPGLVSGNFRAKPGLAGE